MKLKIEKILLCILFITLGLKNSFGQEINDFYFKGPQPRKEDDIKYFPKSIRGLYKSDKDTTRRLRITDDSIYFEVPMVQFCLKADLEKKSYRFEDSVVVTPDSRQLYAIERNDTVFFIDFVQSILVTLDNGCVLRKAEDKYILSKRIGEGKWECFLIYPENQKFCLAYFDFDKKVKEIEGNKKIKKTTEGETSFYQADLKLKDFIKFMDGDYFPNRHYFYKRFDWQ